MPATGEESSSSPPIPLTTEEDLSRPVSSAVEKDERDREDSSSSADVSRSEDEGDEEAGGSIGGEKNQKENDELEDDDDESSEDEGMRLEFVESRDEEAAGLANEPTALPQSWPLPPSPTGGRPAGGPYQRRPARSRPPGFMGQSFIGRMVGSVVVREYPRDYPPPPPAPRHADGMGGGVGGEGGDNDGRDDRSPRARMRESVAAAAAASRRGRGSSDNVSRRRLFRFSQYTDDDMAHMMSIFKSHDEETGKGGKTWTRKLVETTLCKFKWYNPQRDDPDAPSLSKAWCYFEHVTLARRLVNSDDGLHRAEPGDTAQTELYSPLRTPESAFSEWGVGVALYFFTVRAFAVILLLAGIINIANLEYYASDEYNGGTGKEHLPSRLLRGTAICTNRQWVVCTEGCTHDRWEDDPAQYATGVDPITGDTLAFVMRTLCVGGQLPQGMVSYGTLFFLALCFLLLGWYQHVQDNWLDEDNVWSADYTVRVRNPPPDAYDPDVWKEYFEQFSEGPVTAVTVALDNAPLLSALVQRRMYTEKLRLKISGSVEDMDNPQRVMEKVKAHIRDRDAKGASGVCGGHIWKPVKSCIFHPMGLFLPAEKLVKHIVKWTNKVKELQKRKYKVVNVFVTFEMKKDQVLALESTAVSQINLWKKKADAVDFDALFDGKVLDVGKPKEPSTIRWMDLHVKIGKKLGLWLFTLFVMFCIMAIASYVFSLVRDYSIIFYSACISALDCIIPDIVVALLSLEKHDSEGSYETSLYFKITVFRCFFLIILAIIITPFTRALGVERGDLLYTTNALLFSDCFGTPIYRLMDPEGFMRKHFLGPRATTQELMNSNFTGTTYHLGERYTDLTKTVLLILFYSSLDPRSFFFGAIALLVQYCTDKFCLMRIWTTAPFIGTKLSRACRRYFYPTAILVMAVISSRAFVQFPYDNICDSENPAGGYSGEYNITVATGSSETITVEQDDEVIFCQQSLKELPKGFPATAEVQEGSQGRWMNASQETLTNIYGWTAFVIVITYAVVGFGLELGAKTKSIYKKTVPKREEQDNLVGFNTENLGVQLYIPHVNHSMFDFPLLATDIDHINQKLIGWNDPIHSYDFHNLIFDVPWPGMKRTKRILTNTRGAATLSQHKEYEVKESATASTPSALGGDKSISAHGNGNGTAETGEEKSPIFSILKYYPAPPGANGMSARSLPARNKDVNRPSTVSKKPDQTREKHNRKETVSKKSDQTKEEHKSKETVGELFKQEDESSVGWDGSELIPPSMTKKVRSKTRQESDWENEIEATLTYASYSN